MKVKQIVRVKGLAEIEKAWLCRKEHSHERDKVLLSFFSSGKFYRVGSHRVPRMWHSIGMKKGGKCCAARSTDSARWASYQVKQIKLALGRSTSLFFSCSLTF